MNKQELIDKIKASSIEAARKQQIIDLLENNDLTLDIKEQVKTLIQEDIDSDTSVPFTPEDYSAMAAATEQMSSEIANVKNELNKDMEFVENELNDLEVFINDAGKIVDEAQMDALRSKIQN